MKSLFIILIFITGPLIQLFSLGSKTGMMPLQPVINLAVPDGEFLHYSQIIGGEKQMDIYFVTIFTGSGKSRNAVIYEHGIRLSKPSKLPENYSKYRMFFRIDPRIPTLLESSGGYGTNSENAPGGYKGLVYWHYKLNPATGMIEYESRYYDGYELRIRMNKIQSKINYPAWDSLSGSFFAVRFMDIQNSGVFYFVVPEILKEPIPVTLRDMGKETIRTKAGVYKTTRIGLISTDPFLGRLMEPYSRDMLFWIQDSPAG